jgi:hypothetical protein
MQFAFGSYWVLLEDLWVIKTNPIIFEIISKVLGIM